jgi:hypothetical protein
MMETFTTTRSVGQWTPQLNVGSAASEVTAQGSPSFVLYRFVVQAMPSYIEAPNVIDEQMLAQLYAEFAEEDRALANAGLKDYALLLSHEDKA